MKLNVRSIRRRLQKLELYISELERQRSVTLETFRSDTTRQLAVERAFQAAIEACTDTAAHIVSSIVDTQGYQLGHPQESRDVYHFLVGAGYLDASFGDAMMAMVGLRNRIVHLYWDMDTSRMYQYLQEDVSLLHRFRDLILQVLMAEEGSENSDCDPSP